MASLSRVSSSPGRRRLLGLLLLLVVVGIVRQLLVFDTISTYDWNETVQKTLSAVTTNVSSGTGHASSGKRWAGTVTDTADIPILTVDTNNSSAIRASGASTATILPTLPPMARLSNEVCVESPAYPLRTTDFTKNISNTSHFMVQESSANMNATHPISATCRFLHEVPYSRHFPHTMQQIYMCFSWFRHQLSSNAQVSVFLQWDQKKLLASPFVDGFVQLLQRTLGMKFLVEAINTTNINNAVVASSKVHDDNGIFEYFLSAKEDAEALRQAAVQVFDMPNVTGCAASRPRISILNRQAKRHIRNWESLKHALDPLGSPVRVDYFEEKSFREQISVMMNTDILVSPHGAQLTSLPFLPPCASVMEIFPTGYFAPQFFGSLAASSGIAHSFVYLGVNRRVEVERGSRTPKDRMKTRRAKMCPPVQHIKEAAEQLLVAWSKCCEQHLSPTPGA